MVNWINKGQPESFKGEGIVSFLDILGFSQRILKHWGDTNASPLDQLMRFKKNLPVKENQPKNEMTINGEIGFRYICRVSTYSDSIIVSHGLDKPITYGDAILGLSAVLGNIIQVWRNAIAEGFTIRGSIELGDVFWNSKELIGPAFINAYELESQFAKSSRVILGSNLVKMVKETLSQAESMREPLLKYLQRDTDGFIILNPAMLITDNESTIPDDLTSMQDNCTDYFQKEKYRALIHHVRSSDSNKGLLFEQLSSY